MKKLLGIIVLGLLWCNISFSDNYKLFSTEEYISKKDAQIIFEMSRVVCHVMAFIDLIRLNNNP